MPAPVPFQTFQNVLNMMFKMLLLVPSFISQVSATMYFHHCSLVTGPACFFCIHKEYYVCSNKQEMFSWYSFILIAAPKQHQTISIQQRNTQVTFQGCLLCVCQQHYTAGAEGNGITASGQYTHNTAAELTAHSQAQKPCGDLAPFCYTFILGVVYIRKKTLG